MKSNHLFVLLMVLVLGAPTAFASESKVATENATASPKMENKLSEEEASRMTKRIEEIRDMDKTDLTVSEKRALRKELKETKKNIREDGGYIYISAGTVIVILLVLLIVL